MCFLSRLFENRYTPYEFKERIVEKVELYEQVEDVRYSHGYGISDPLDVMSVPTGKFVEYVYDLYVCYHKVTNLPKYKRVYL